MVLSLKQLLVASLLYVLLQIINKIFNGVFETMLDLGLIVSVLMYLRGVYKD